MATFAQYVDGLKAKEVRVLKDVYKSPSGTRAIAFVEDPNGIPVELLEPRAKSEYLYRERMTSHHRDRSEARMRP